MENLFDGLEYVEKYVLFEQDTTYWYDIINYNKDNFSVVIRKKHFEPYVILITDSYTLKYSTNELTLTCIISGQYFDRLDEPNITEEWFFQLSTVKNFGGLEYIEIEFVREVYNRWFNSN